MWSGRKIGGIGPTNPERFERVKEILLRAADLPEAERQAFLDPTCEGEPDLRGEIDELLAKGSASPLIPRCCGPPPVAGFVRNRRQEWLGTITFELRPRPTVNFDPQLGQRIFTPRCERRSCKP